MMEKIHLVANKVHNVKLADEDEAILRSLSQGISEHLQPMIDQITGKASKAIENTGKLVGVGGLYLYEFFLTDICLQTCAGQAIAQGVCLGLQLDILISQFQDNRAICGFIIEMQKFLDSQGKNFEYVAQNTQELIKTLNKVAKLFENIIVLEKNEQIDVMKKIKRKLKQSRKCIINIALIYNSVIKTLELAKQKSLVNSITGLILGVLGIATGGIILALVDPPMILFCCANIFFGIGNLATSGWSAYNCQKSDKLKKDFLVIQKKIEQIQKQIDTNLDLLKQLIKSPEVNIEQLNQLIVSHQGLMQLKNEMYAQEEGEEGVKEF